MATVFSTAPGKVFRFEEPGVPFSLSLQGFNGAVMRAIITQFDIEAEANVSFRKSLDRLIYFYVMGMKLGQCQLSGVLFPDSCDANVGLAVGGGQAANVAQSGLENTYDYFLASSVASTGKPVTISFGRKTVEGFLMKWRGGVTDPSTGLGAFSFVFHHVPKEPKKP
mgnify:CR=1 FL=1